MATVYKNKDRWYITVHLNGERLTRSLKTKDKRVALRLKPQFESELISELTGLKVRCENLTFPELSDKFIKHHTHWAESTYKLIKYILSCHIQDKPLPSNPTSKAIHIRHINQCWNWGLKHKLIRKANKIKGDIKGEPRHRTFSKKELDLIFSTSNNTFNDFIKFAYYTGARSGEIRSISRDNLLEESVVVYGKSGRRIVKLNNQAKEIIHNQETLWSYTKDYVSKKFKKKVRRLGIKNARFHDLRRTFGLNLIKQGMSIYKVSKLLGHSSVRTTEQHYAPLLTVEIEDFTL